MNDLKIAYDRVGDRTLSTARGRVKVFIMIIVVSLIGYCTAIQYQQYIQSFAESKQEVIKTFTHIEPTPSWKMVITYN